MNKDFLILKKGLLKNDIDLLLKSIKFEKIEKYFYIDETVNSWFVLYLLFFNNNEVKLLWLAFIWKLSKSTLDQLNDNIIGFLPYMFKWLDINITNLQEILIWYSIDNKKVWIIKTKDLDFINSCIKSIRDNKWMGFISEKPTDTFLKCFLIKLAFYEDDYKKIKKDLNQLFLKKNEIKDYILSKNLKIIKDWTVLYKEEKICFLKKEEKSFIYIKSLYWKKEWVYCDELIKKFNYTWKKGSEEYLNKSVRKNLKDKLKKSWVSISEFEDIFKWWLTHKIIINKIGVV